MFDASVEFKYDGTDPAGIVMVETVPIGQTGPGLQDWGAAVVVETVSSKPFTT
jgi:hypothetical protein